MTSTDIGELVEQYRAGVDAELHLLALLADVAQHQRDATGAGDLTRFTAVADERDALMRNLVALEEHLRAIRVALGDDRDHHETPPAYAEIATRHREASQVITRILATDQESITALADAELARRSAVSSLDRGEATLAAYRRVLTPPLEHAKLVDKVG